MTCLDRDSREQGAISHQGVAAQGEQGALEANHATSDRPSVDSDAYLHGTLPVGPEDPVGRREHTECDAEGHELVVGLGLVKVDSDDVAVADCEASGLLLVGFDLPLLRMWDHVDLHGAGVP